MDEAIQSPASLLWEFAEPGETSDDFAERLDISTRWMERFLKGLEPLTDERAQQIAEATGTDVRCWMLLEVMYRDALWEQRRALAEEQRQGPDRPQQEKSGPEGQRLQ